MDIIWNITGRCNLSCLHCWDRFKTEPESKLDVIKDKIDAISQTHVDSIIFTGGEPFVRKDFWEVLEHASARGIENLKVCTNGTMLTDNIDNILSSPLTEIHISLDDVDDTLFRKNTSKQIQEIVQLSEKIDLDKCKVVLVSVLDLHDINKYLRVVDFAKAHNLKSSFQFLSLLDNENLSEHSSDSISSELFSDVFSQLKNTVKANPDVIDFFANFYLKNAEKHYLDKATNFECGAGDKFKIISPQCDEWDCYKNKSCLSDKSKCFDESCLIWCRSDNRGKRISALMNKWK